MTHQPCRPFLKVTLVNGLFFPFLRWCRFCFCTPCYVAVIRQPPQLLHQSEQTHSAHSVLM